MFKEVPAAAGPYLIAYSTGFGKCLMQTPVLRQHPEEAMVRVRLQSTCNLHLQFLLAKALRILTQGTLYVYASAAVG